MEQDYIVHSWQLRHPMEADDDVNDLHVAIDIDSMSVVADLLDEITRFELNLACEPFPDKSPVHIDEGQESYMKHYGNEVFDFEQLHFLITHEEDEILLWNNGNTDAYIKLTEKRLKEFKAAMQHTRINPLMYGNVIEATRITDDNEFKPCKIVLWAASKGAVIYY
ncbi:MAG: hypothetical protein HYZ16_01640 [Bacteroidetes bacterium]|nr:hypothetical protein [Bacteroidota bacterium]